MEWREEKRRVKKRRLMETMKSTTRTKMPTLIPLPLLQLRIASSNRCERTCVSCGDADDVVMMRKSFFYHLLLRIYNQAVGVALEAFNFSPEDPA